jgi:dihydrofolate reductase
LVQREGEDYGYEDFIQKTDTVIMGRKTYEKNLAFDEFPHKSRNCIVLTRQNRKQDPYVTFYSDGIKKLMEELQSKTRERYFY